MCSLYGCWNIVIHPSKRIILVGHDRTASVSLADRWWPEIACWQDIVYKPAAADEVLVDLVIAYTRNPSRVLEGLHLFLSIYLPDSSFFVCQSSEGS